MGKLNIKKDFIDGEKLPAQDLNNNFKMIEKGMHDLEGESPYQIALRNGFIGTEEEWLATLVGPQGPQGEQGPMGDPGSAYGYTLGNFPVEEGGTSVSLRSDYDVNNYNIEKVYGLDVSVIGKAYTSPFLPEKCVRIETRQLNLLKITTRGIVTINQGDANVFGISCVLINPNNGETFGGQSITRPLSQLVNNVGIAETLIENTFFVDVSNVDLADLFITLSARLYDESGSATAGMCVVFPFEIFIEGYK